MEKVPSLLPKFWVSGCHSQVWNGPSFISEPNSCLVFCCSRGWYWKNTTQNNNNNNNTYMCTHTHITPKVSMQICTQHTCTLTTIKKQKQTKKPTAVSSWVHLELEEIPDHWHAKANLYVFYSGNFPDQGLLWDSEIQWSLRAQANHQLQMQYSKWTTRWHYMSVCPFLPDWGGGTIRQ